MSKFEISHNMPKIIINHLKQVDNRFKVKFQVLKLQASYEIVLRLDHSCMKVTKPLRDVNKTRERTKKI